MKLPRILVHTLFTLFNGYNMIEWQYLFAASLYAIVPVVILFVGIEKNLVGGLTSGGVKG